MALHQDGQTQRRINLAMPNTEALSLLSTSHSSGPSGPPSWRRFAAPAAHRAVASAFHNKLYILPAALLILVLVISYFIFDVRINIGFHRACSNGTEVRSGDSGAFYYVDLKNETLLEDNTWRGYAHYMHRLGAISIGPSKSQRLKVAGRGPYGFAHFSSYRMAPNAIAVVGFGARLLRDSSAWRSKRCWWEGPGNTTIQGDFHVLYAEEHGDLTYDTIVLQCYLERTTDDTGGVLFATIESEDIAFYKEEIGKKNMVKLPATERLPFWLTVCSPSMRTPVEPRAMVEFVEYHRHLGMSHFLLYDAGAFSEALADVIGEYLRSGIVEVVPFREIQKYEVWQEGMHLAYHDCLYRSRMTSRWVAVLNWDEYLYVAPPSTLLTLLANYDGHPWISHGTNMWSTLFCRPGPPLYGSRKWSYNAGRVPFLIERMVFRWPHVVCHGPPEGVDANFCPGGFGERKYICDPRQVDTLRQFEVGISAKGGEHLSVEKIRHQRFPYLYDAANLSRACSKTIPEGESVNWWLEDREQARSTRLLRESDYPLT